MMTLYVPILGPKKTTKDGRVQVPGEGFMAFWVFDWDWDALIPLLLSTSFFFDCFLGNLFLADLLFAFGTVIWHFAVGV